METSVSDKFSLNLWYYSWLHRTKKVFPSNLQFPQGRLLSLNNKHSIQKHLFDFTFQENFCLVYKNSQSYVSRNLLKIKMPSQKRVLLTDILKNITTNPKSFSKKMSYSILVMRRGYVLWSWYFHGNQFFSNRQLKFPDFEKERKNVNYLLCSR